MTSTEGRNPHVASGPWRLKRAGRPRPSGIRDPDLVRGGCRSPKSNSGDSSSICLFGVAFEGTAVRGPRSMTVVRRSSVCLAVVLVCGILSHGVEAAYGIKTKNYGSGSVKSPIRERIEMSHNYRTGAIKSPVMERIEMSSNSSAWCDVPPNPNAASTSCQRKRGSMRCTANCMTGFEFPDGKRHMTLNCDLTTRQWTPLQQFPDCQGVCRPPCLHGGRCYGNNRCVCSNQYRGDHCQYPISLCDGHMLGAGGSSWHCNHTHVETLCEVSCPTGFVFQSPGAAPVYRCSLQGVWDPPIVPPCVPDYTSSFRTNVTAQGDFHQGQQTITEVDEHNGQNQQQQKPDVGDHVTEASSKKNLTSESQTANGFDLPPNEIPGENELPPPSTGVCSTWGHFQFKSFDGTLFRFAGACSYVLLKDCAEPDPSAKFALELQYSAGCPDAANCARILHLVGAAAGERVSLPLGLPPPEDAQPLVDAIPGLSAQYAGKYLVLQSTQGYTVWIDKESVQIRVTPALRETACGLCGHFDGEPSNDLMVLDARSALTPREFGISWVVERDCIHSGLEREACAIQSSADKNVSLTAFDRCSIIFNDIYRECHKVLKPNRFFESCQQDCCDRRSPSGCECATLDEYFRECQRLGVQLQETWRRDTVCPHTCDGGREYRECGPACRATCADREPACALSQCASGCHCPEGMLWDNGRCVEPRQCACTFRDRKYQAGEQIDQDCNTCVCEDGRWQCTAAICDATCSVLLGSIYSTFDGGRFQTRGHCGFILLQAEGIRVIQNRHVCAGLPKDAVCLGDIHIQVGENVLVSINQQLQVLVNARELTSLPAVLPNVTIMKPTSFFIEVETKGLTLLTDGKSRLVLTATEGLYTKTMGMCGTFNHNSQDDFLCPGGDVDYQVESFAKQWADGECAGVEAVTAQCDQDSLLWPESKHMCRQLYQGAFTVCHHSVNPDPYFELCIQASCGCHSDSGDCLCPVFSHYAHACASKGHVIDWRPQVPICGVYCEQGQTYQSCAPVCDSSCALIGRNASCGGRCVEGCACEPGFSLDRRGRCVPVSQCGCLFAGHEYPAGFKQRRHGQHCECLGAQWQCRPASADEVILVPPAGECGANEEYTECRSNCPATCASLHSPPAAGSCAVDVCQAGCQCRKGFVRDERTGSCVPPTSCPCQHGLRSYADGDKIDIECNQCTCERGRWLCTQHECAGTCALWGDSHVRTFDGVSFDFRGTCDYVLAKGRLSGNESVSVVVQNVPCGSKSSCAKTVSVLAGSEEPLVLTEGHPVPPVREESGLSIRTIGLFVAVYVRGSLSVYWDKHTRIYVVAGPAWAGKLSGLCGNFNGDGTDEFRSPSGGPALPQAEEFVDAWRLHSYCAPTLPAQHGCLQRPDRRDWAASRCAALKERPFRECHSEVDVQPFYDRCVSDTCSCDTGGDCECLCTALSAYAHECAQRGVRVLWRSQELCPVQCETCDEYSACVSGCEPPNCAHPASETDCPEAAPVCLEGCTPARCPTGEVHRNATDHRCVPYADCEAPPETGCNVGGVLYKEGQRVATPNPCQSCYCKKGQIECIGRPCPLELMTCNQSGWSDWYSMTTPEFQRGNDFEILLAHADRCPVDNMAEVECRTIDGHVPWNETGEPMLCSVATGLRCLKEDQYDGSCSDYEMRVYCQCAEETTPAPFIPTTVTLTGPYCDAWTPWINQDSPSDDGGDNELLANIAHFSEICPELAAVECLPVDPAHSGHAGEEMNKFAEPCNKKGLLCLPGTPCVDYKVRAYCKCPSTEVPSTQAPVVTTTISVCPPGSRWSDCGIRCNATCDHFLHALRSEGFCVGDDAVCVSGCFGAGSHCGPDGLVHFDRDSCVPAQQCPCSVPGREAPLAPGEVVEQDCEKCQCLYNKVSCVSVPGCGTTIAPEATTTSAPTTVWSPSPEGGCWTPWLNDDRPEGPGDFEDLRTLQAEGKACVEPAAIECRVAGEKTHSTQTGQKMECSLRQGLRCWNSDNGPHGCLDYEVRLYCPCVEEEEFVTTTTMEVIVPECRQGWSSWINSHPVDNLGDHETLQSVVEAGLLDCPRPSSIECREAGTQVPWNQLGMIGVRCDLSSGLLCRSSSQPKGRSCVDFEVRFYCDCGEPTTLPPRVTTTTTLAPTTVAVVTTQLPCAYWSDWFDTSRPGVEGNNGDREPGVRGHPQLQGFCEHGYVSAASCRNDEDADFSETGQLGLTCTPEDGFTCSDADQPAGRRCDNYKIRFYCSCEGPVTTEIVVIPTKPATPHPSCSSFIRVIDGPEPLSDSNLKASSSRDPGSGPQAARLRSLGSWVPNPGSGTEFIEVDIGKVTKVYGIETAGDPAIGAWVTSFSVLYSQDAIAYSQISNPDGSPKVLGANHDASSVHKQYFEEPFEARFVRIQPLSWENQVALKLDLLICAIETFTVKPTWTPGSHVICQEPMGLENGLLDEQALHASSERDEEHEANQGRLGGHSWVAGVADKHQYLQVDFGEPRELTAVVTKGREEAAQWVTSYTVQHSNNAHRWSTIKDTNGDDVVFPGNFDASTAVTRVFPRPVSARYLRIVPVTWKNWIALQLEVLGCEPAPRPTVTTPVPTTTVTEGGIVEWKFSCPEPNGLFPDMQNCRRFYHCSNDQPHHKWCPAELHFNPKLLVCDWPHNAGCEVKKLRILTLPPTEEPCVAYGPWVSTSEPTPETGGDVEDVARVVAESGLCLFPMGIECREYATDADYSKTGQVVSCDVERGLRCVDSDQTDGRTCLNYKVRVKCWTCAPPTTTELPTVPPAVLCPEVEVTDNATFCPQGCPFGFACDGDQCVHVADCPCVRDGKRFPVGGMLETRTCHECQCHLGGRSSCLPKACPPCPKGRPQTVSADCSCECGSCPDGHRLCPTSAECIADELWCDGVVNCPDDETDCERTTTVAPCPPLVTKFCAKGETLVLVKDELGCEQYVCESGVPPPATAPPPIVESECELVGHHFKTFDGREFDYSYCNHVLVRDAAAGNISISVQRNCALEDEASCPKRVRIEQLGHRIVLGTDLSVRVDDFEYTAKQLPLLAERIPEFEIMNIGEQLYFRSRVYSIELKLDVRGRVGVTVNTSLNGTLAGLCGFFNGEPSDDFVTPSGSQASSVVEFGDSWPTPGAGEECRPLECPKEMLIAAAAICNKLREEPLSACPGLDTQLSNCISATCECLQRGNGTSESECACEAYLDAVTHCDIENRDEVLQGWRLRHGCVPDCPPEMQWLDCGPECQLTCQHFLNGEVGCASKKACNPGCFCPPGTVLDGDICKNPDECADKVCTGYGDPTIETFDGWKFQLQSSGHFDLVSDSEGRFTVDGVTGKCDERLTCIVGLNVEHKNHVARIRRHMPAVIDGDEYEAKDLPWKGDGITVFAMPGRVTVVLFRELGVQVRYNEISAAFTIHVPSKNFFNRTEGLCGNCNGQPDDDKKKKDGTISDDLLDFICSWETQLSPEECVMNFTGVEPTAPPPPGACSEMLDRSVFGECPNLVDVSKYLDQCRRDTALSVTENAATCASLVEYAHSCCRAGVHVDDAYIQRFCNITCPGDTAYMSCHDGCPQTCDAEYHAENSGKGVPAVKSHYHAADCKKLLVDGCFCPEGSVFLDGICRPREVCELCDEEGHKVGDEWQRDKCTHCTCKKGGRADCQHEVCPADPVCREDQKLVRLSDKDRCCDEKHCQDVVERCPELSLPKCSKGDVAKTRTDEAGCPVYFCECDPALCPAVVWPTDLEIGQEVVMTPQGCCATLEAVCYPEKCPPEPSCPPGAQLAATPGACCNNYKCKAPEGVCLYTHQYEVNDEGREVPVEVHRQNVSFYEANSGWKDGLCRNCSCDGSGSQFMARCTHETCYESAELPDDKDYYLTVVDVPLRCCPTIVRLFCKDDYGNIREPGDVWQSREDPCQSHVCERTAAGEVHKVLRSIVCPKCPENSQEIAPAPGECCSRCQVVACDEAGTLHPVGTRWNSTIYPCYVASCEQQGDSVRTVYNSPSCPPVPKRCPKDMVVWDENHCCQKCNITTVSEEVCSPAPMDLQQTLRKFTYRHQKWGLCINTEPVQGAMECAGNCESHAYFATGSADELHSDCKCCKPSSWSTVKIELRCQNGRKLAGTFNQPIACSCAPCVPYTREREDLPGNHRFLGVKVPLTNTSIYKTMQGDQPSPDQEAKKPNIEAEAKPYNPQNNVPIAQKPFSPEEAEENPIKFEPISQVVQDISKPEDIPASSLPNTVEPIVQEPFRPEDVSEPPKRFEPISQVGQKPYRPEAEQEPNPKNLGDPTTQEPLRPDYATELQNRPESTNQIQQEPYTAEYLPEPTSGNPLGPIEQKPLRPEDVTEQPKQPESNNQIVQEPYRPEDVPLPTPAKPEGLITQEPSRPEVPTEQPKSPEPMSQIVQEPYRREDVPEPTPAKPTGPIAQEPFRPGDMTEQPEGPEPISEIVQEPYRPEDVPEPTPAKPTGPIAQEPFRPEYMTEQPKEPESNNQIVQEPYRPEDAPQPTPAKPEGLITQQPSWPEVMTEQPRSPELMSQIVQEPYRPGDVPEQPPAKPAIPIIQEPFKPEDVTEQPKKPESISQIVQEPYRPEDVSEPTPAKPLRPIAQEAFKPEDVTEQPKGPEPISQTVQEPYRPEDVSEQTPAKPAVPIAQEPFKPEDGTEQTPAKPAVPIAQEPFKPEDVTEQPGGPEPVSQIVQEPYRPEDISESTPVKPLGPIAQEPFRPEDVTEQTPAKPAAPITQEPFEPEVTEQPKGPEPISQIVQEPYRPEDISEPPPAKPLGPIAQEPFRPEDVTEQPKGLQPISPIVQELYRPEIVPEPIAAKTEGPIAQEPSRPEDMTEQPKWLEPISQILQEPYRSEDVPESTPAKSARPIVQEPFKPDDELPRPPQPFSQVVQEPYHPEDAPRRNLSKSELPIAQEPSIPEVLKEQARRPGSMSQISQEPYRPEDVVEQQPQSPFFPISQESYRPEDIAEPKSFSSFGPIAQQPYRPEDAAEPFDFGLSQFSGHEAPVAPGRAGQTDQFAPGHRKKARGGSKRSKDRYRKPLRDI
ncbi:SCO-spondin-like [Dermacentor albipictus]|uniref:SCO-spondin-like n=1 Tax=Dermacentor albipictus TaxID=60249 RepID=UPI0038FC337D